MVSDNLESLGERYLRKLLCVLEGFTKLDYGISANARGNRNLGERFITVYRDSLIIVDDIGYAVNNVSAGEINTVIYSIRKLVCIGKIMSIRALIYRKNRASGEGIGIHSANACGNNDILKT